MNPDIKECHKKVPKYVMISEIGEISVEKGQRECENQQREKSQKNTSR